MPNSLIVYEGTGANKFCEKMQRTEKKMYFKVAETEQQEENGIQTRKAR
jgi:hypothetical protein